MKQQSEESWKQKKKKEQKKPTHKNHDSKVHQQDVLFKFLLIRLIDGKTSRDMN